MVDGWPLIEETDYVVGPIVPIQRKSIGPFGYPALVLGRTPFLDFGSSFGQGYFAPKGIKRHVPFGRLFRHLLLARNQPKGDQDQGEGQGFFEQRERSLNLSQAMGLGYENSGACSNQLLVGLLPF